MPCPPDILPRLIVGVSLAALLMSSLAPQCAADPIPWDTQSQGSFLTALARDAYGNVWVAPEEGSGAWEYSLADKVWNHHPPTADLSGDIYALACEKNGRVWLADANGGVSCWNGREWGRFDAADGPIGSRVFCLAVCPTDGSVWMGTDCGLARYHDGVWAYVTRADGLPSDQIGSLAFDKTGNLYDGTQCDGLAIAHASDGYTTWRTVPGPSQMPNASGGSGLPSALINCVFASPTSGTIYVGTPNGLARSGDGGKTWRFVRGVDWTDKVKGLWHGPPPAPSDTPGLLLLEDWVTALAEDAAGNLVIGHRAKGYEVADMKAGQRLYPGPSDNPSDDYITSILPLRDGGLLLARYGGGLLQAPPLTSLPVSLPLAAAPTAVPPLPLPAKPPTLAQLTAMLHQVEAMKMALPPGGAAYLGDDWQTKGDWIGRYGRQYGFLCAIASPVDNDIAWRTDFNVETQMGPHHYVGDSLRHYLSWPHTDNRNTLYSPDEGRIQAEVDDHGEELPMWYSGPDIWLTVTLPEGVHRVSLYFFNKDAHEWDAWKLNRYRDYLIEVKPYQKSLDDADAAPALARARVNSFWGGVYKQFIMRGPGKYYVKIGRNNSINTICSGVFIDQLLGPHNDLDDEPLPFMNEVDYDPPALGPLEDEDQEMQAARNLWTALDKAYEYPGSYPLQQRYRLLAYRSAVANDGSSDLLENWRWHLHLWEDSDRLEFDSTMELVQNMEGFHSGVTFTHTAKQRPSAKEKP